MSGRRYDDTPLYAQGKEVIVHQASPLAPVKPKIGLWKGFHKSAASPSPLLSWWLNESVRRNNGDINGLDNAEIEAALKGFTNKWSDSIKDDKKKLEDFLKNQTKEMWSEIKMLKK